MLDEVFVQLNISFMVKLRRYFRQKKYGSKFFVFYQSVLIYFYHLITGNNRNHVLLHVIPFGRFDCSCRKLPP